MLRRFIETNPKGAKLYNFNDDLDLAKLMCANLLKANSEVRLASLLILKMFKPLTFVDKEGLSDNFKNEECLCIDYMYEFQRTEIGFAHERGKITSLERLEVLVKTGALPRVYSLICLNFLLGSLWTKFTPIIPQIQSCIATLVKCSSEDL